MNFNFTNLKVGSLVELELMSTKNKMIKLKTIVEEIIDESRIKLFAPISKGTTYPIRLNQSFTLITVHKYPTVDKYDILSCRCKVVDKLKEGRISTIEIVKTGLFQTIQRRNYFRLPLIKTIEFLHEGKTYEMLSKDLSGNGIRGYVSKKLADGSEGILYLQTPEKMLELRFNIIDCLPDPEHSYRYEMRATFRNIKNSQLSLLLKYIFSKQSESIRKQINLKDYVSILDSEKSYSDFFSMTNLEKIVRITPILLWGLTLIEYGYLINAFREQNMGLNFFFGEFTRNFKPELLTAASTISLIIFGLTILSFILNINVNKRTKGRINIHLSVIAFMSAVVFIIYSIFI